MSKTLADEVSDARNAARTMIGAYTQWGAKIQYGEEIQGAHLQMLDYVNFRIETADSCLLLIENGRIGDALGLCRSLLENYLLFMLMCRGTKYLRVEQTDLKGAAFKAHLKMRQAELKQLQDEGMTPCLAVEKHPRASNRIIYIFEGIKGEITPDFSVPLHFLLFQQFRPETLRLKDEDYFQYFEPSAETKKAVKGHRATAELHYNSYLSYFSLLDCLELNELVDDKVIARIEAHYTFLGKFLHPTHNAAKDLVQRPNFSDDRTRIGSGQAYTDIAVLLAYLYVCYLLAAFLDEVAGLFEQAPKKYIANPGTTDLRTATARIPVDFPYFWFLFNDPPLYDRFIYCVSHASPEELTEWGGYEHVPFERVEFNQYIYDHLRNALNGQRNAKCGDYPSPLG